MGCDMLFFVEKIMISCNLMQILPIKILHHWTSLSKCGSATWTFRIMLIVDATLSIHHWRRPAALGSASFDSLFTHTPVFHLLSWFWLFYLCHLSLCSATRLTSVPRDVHLGVFADKPPVTKQPHQVPSWRSGGELAAVNKGYAEIALCVCASLQ